LPAPWSIVVVAGALVVEVGEAWFWWKLSHRRRPAVGVESLVGMRATVITPCRPTGQVRVAGELWQARCAAGADPGDVVRVVAVDGLALLVVS
jgi:membrane protein implicated in regulation of membrane protease activity